LALDVDLALFAGLRSDRPAFGVKRAGVPGAVPGLFLHGLEHVGVAPVDAVGFRGLAHEPIKRGEVARGVEEEAGDHDRLGFRAADVAGALEGLVRFLGETVQVEAVVPIGVADQRQAVRPAVVQGVGD